MPERIIVTGLTPQGNFELYSGVWSSSSPSSSWDYDLAGWLNSLRGQVSTDELYPVPACFYFKDIGQFALGGDRTGLIKEKDLQERTPQVLIGGQNFGCGSAREHAAISLQEAGIRLVIAPSFNDTFRDNCTYNGLLTSTDLSLVRDVLASGEISPEKILSEFDGVKREILERGGLFAYNQARLKGEIKSPEARKGSRPMTIAEKIIARHLASENVSVRPGDPLFVSVDWRFSYEVFTPLAAEMLERSPLADYGVESPETVIFFADHFIMSDEVTVSDLLSAQENFATREGVRLKHAQRQGGGICHQVMIEENILPGQVVVGTDSHTGTGGVLGAFCFPVGVTALTNALATKDVLVKVPSTRRVNFKGKLPTGCLAKDVMLHLLSHEWVKTGQATGEMIEYGGPALENWSVDELSVLTNMATEVGAITAIVEPNLAVKTYLSKERSLSDQEIGQLLVRPDPGAEYSEVIEIDLSQIKPMVVLPGSPHNSLPLELLGKRVSFQKAFIGSCVGGKLTDLRAAAGVLTGRSVKQGIELVVQPASMKTYRQADDEGLIEIFLKAGARVVLPACGACIGQGPGRVEEGEVSVSCANRNYPGRTGRGKTYLASPLVVAASSVTGFLCGPEELSS